MTDNKDEAAEVSATVVDTGAKDGQSKCPVCGATAVSFNVGIGTLVCEFCRHAFVPEKAIGLDTDLSRLEGTTVGSGTLNIAADAEDAVTLKCESCSAEVVVDTAESAQARCHWCRNTLSVNRQIPNGSVPDMVLPFNVSQDAARAEIQKFVKKRRFYAHPTFKKEFCTENVMGVYLPYMVIGINSRASFKGRGECLIREYEIRDETYYDADLYDVEREFDLVIDGLSIISSSDKLDRTSDRTNNIINAIKPFDSENCVRWNANYLKGFASEKRTVNIDDLKESIEVKAKDISRHKAAETVTQYDRGVRWSKEELDMKGQQWKAAYLPIWLYSYQQKLRGGESLLHYVAVNARTLKVMGSVPVNHIRLFVVSAIIQIIALIVSFPVLLWLEDDFLYGLVPVLTAGAFYYGYKYFSYRNTDARFMHETETKTVMGEVQKSDVLIEHLTGLEAAEMEGANHKAVNYDVSDSQPLVETL